MWPLESYSLSQQCLCCLYLLFAHKASRDSCWREVSPRILPGCHRVLTQKHAILRLSSTASTSLTVCSRPPYYGAMHMELPQSALRKPAELLCAVCAPNVPMS